MVKEALRVELQCFFCEAIIAIGERFFMAPHGKFSCIKCYLAKLKDAENAADGKEKT